MSPPRTSPIFEALPIEDGCGLRLVGELDMATVSDLRRMLETLSPDGHPGGVTLDLADLSFIDSSGLHALEDHARALNGARPLVLVNASGHIRRLFAISGMERSPNIELRGEVDHG